MREFTLRQGPGMALSHGEFSWKQQDAHKEIVKPARAGAGAQNHGGQKAMSQIQADASLPEPWGTPREHSRAQGPHSRTI